jgi:hypothetical protein
MKKSLYFFTFLIYGCNSSNEPSLTSRNIFSLQVESNYSGGENWVILHDINGEIIDYRAFKNSDKLVFENDKAIAEDKINVTILKYQESSGSISHIVESFLAVDAGITWTLKAPATLPTSLPQIGEASIEISNVSDFYMYAFTNKIGSTGSSEWSGGTGILKVNPPLFAGASNYLVSIDPGVANPKYKYFENLLDNDLIKLSLNDFQEYDSYLDVSFPPTKDVIVYVQGFESDRPTYFLGYLLYQGLSPYKADKTSLKIGYLNRFDRYLSTVTVNYLNSRYYYTKSGTKPASISLPFSLTVNLTNTTFKNYSYSVNGEFIYRSSSYESRDLTSTPYKFVSWVVHAESGKKIVGDLPAELRVKFPAIQTDKLVHLSSSYITKGHTYSDYINFNLNRTSQDDPFEEAGVKVK